MRQFMDQDFLLTNEVAKTLYHSFAKDMPIFDYHCHLSSKEIAENKAYENITQLWLGGDHYKWRVMRSNGVSEDYITGNQSDYDKFLSFAKTIPYTIGNPMYHWTHLELKRYFGIDAILNETTAPEIWDQCNVLLATEEFRAKSLITRSKVSVICTTDDPIDNLIYHTQIAEDVDFETIVMPTFRPDKGINIHLATFLPWLEQLGHVVGNKINSFDELLQALEQRIDFFHTVGCRLSDHALDEVDYQTVLDMKHSLMQADQRNQRDQKDSVFQEGIHEEVTKIFEKACLGQVVSPTEVTLYKSMVIHFLGKLYAKKGWVMQLHIGALRNNSSRMHQMIGPDTGFDSINDTVFARNLSQLLNDLDTLDLLPKTILYVLNPRDNYVIGTMIGNFQGGGIPGKIQFGSGWWFCDQKDGMIDQMKTLSQLGLISRFVGMLTDSRSFLSYIRHEYFRRLLCNLFGEWVENGEYPYDIEFLGKVVQDICFNNAQQYFQL